MRTKTSNGEPFYLYLNFFILIFVAGAFGINGVINFEKLPPVDAIFVIHGFFMLAWYSLIVIQAKLINSKKHPFHIAVGKFSIALVIGMLISEVLMSISSYHRSASVDIITINLFIMVNFVTLYSLALYYVKSSDKHKRLMLMASISMLIPAFGRATQAAGINDFLAILMLIIILIFPIVYDIKTLKKVHKSTILGCVLIILGVVFTVILIENATWQEIVDSLLG